LKKALLKDDMTASEPERRWFQFSLRTLLVFVTLCAVPCSWLGVKLQQARRERKLATEIEMCGGSVSWSKPSGPDWLRRVLGDDVFRHVYFVDLGNTNVTDVGLERFVELTQVQELCLINAHRITDAGLEHLMGLKRLQTLVLFKTHITDTGLERLKGLRQLRSLHLGETRITNDGLRHLKELDKLTSLDLRKTRVSDAGMEHLKELKHLDVLWLNATQVTDSGIEHLKKLGRLRQVGLTDTKVTKAGVKKFKEALPTCRIEYDTWLNWLMPGSDDYNHL
jgi:hypothetical protein